MVLFVKPNLAVFRVEFIFIYTLGVVFLAGVIFKNQFFNFKTEEKTRRERN